MDVPEVGENTEDVQKTSSHGGQESDGSKSEASSSDTSSSKSGSSSSQTTTTDSSSSGRSEVNSSLDKSQNISADGDIIENVFDINNSVEKSSPFHGFSSQDDDEPAAHDDACSNEKEEINKELKQQMFADFGIGNENSEEETENSDYEPDSTSHKGPVNIQEEESMETTEKSVKINQDSEENLEINDSFKTNDPSIEEEINNSQDECKTAGVDVKGSELMNEEATQNLDKKGLDDQVDNAMDVDEDDFPKSKSEDCKEISVGDVKEVRQSEPRPLVVSEPNQIDEEKKEEETDKQNVAPEVFVMQKSVSPPPVDKSGTSNLSNENKSSLNENKTLEGTERRVPEPEKISPIKVGSISPTKSSPKKVHFSPDLESFRKESPPRPIMAEMPSLEEFDDKAIPPITESTPKNKKSKEKISPLRLKIKFGKDKTGAITHGKIKSKGNYSSDEEPRNPKILEMVKPQHQDEEIVETYQLPENPDDFFHGFPDSSIPDWVCDNFSSTDLKTKFQIKPTVFVSISSKKSQQKQQQQQHQTIPPNIDTPVAIKVKTPEPPAVETPKPEKHEQHQEIPKLILAVPNQVGEQYIPVASKKEKKRSDKNLNYIKPLYDGWVRELIWRTPADSKKPDADVFYYPPDPPGQTKIRFKSPNELEGYLITSASMYPINFFTFKKEPIGGPEGMEIIRNFSYTLEKASSGCLSSPESPQKDTLGKRVSKPPEKLNVENAEPETPSRTSKRVIKPPDKFELDYSPVPKVAKVDTPDKIQLGTPIVKAKPEKAKLGEVESSAEKQESAGKLPEKGILKLKMFSKMNVKNQLTGSDSSRNNSEVEDNDIMVVDENVPKKVEMPIPSGMTITKVKKSTNETITLPGVPTIGPPPMPYGQAPTNQASSISITPLSNRPVGMSIPPPPMEPVKATPKIIRPSKPTLLPCSIHCPGVSGFPSLSCTSCHCLFHPKCVGLPNSLGSSSQHEFYCNDCQPSSSSTVTTVPNQALQPEKPKQLTPHAPGVPIAPAKSANLEVSKKIEPTVAKPPEVKKAEVVKPKDTQKPSKPQPPAPPKPFEGQTMINIAGKKFLVIPHPAPVSIESPPPSPPPTRAPSGLPSTQSTSNSDKPVNEKLDVLLKPVENYPKMPCFEVELTPEGKYLLTAKDNNSKNLFGESSQKPQVVAHNQSPSWGNNFSSNVSGGYHGMMEVFKYLSVKERVQAACVCKLWRDIAFHQVLWKTVSLKNTRVFDWKGFAKFFNQTKSGHLDVRKMLFVKDREATWMEIISIAPEFLMLKKLELPKLSGSVLTELVSACPRLESVHAPLTTPPLDINVFSKMTQLKELKLKSSAGAMLRVSQGISDLSKLAPRLTQLSLLTMEGLQQKDFDVFGTLVHLKLLEIGECHNAPPNIFKTLSELSKLQRLRMEKGSVGENVSKLANAPRLKDLELIDFQILKGFRDGLSVIKNIQKFLIIPTYKNEVAKINSEIVEGVTKEMNHLSSFYLGVTNEWLEAMALAMGSNKANKAGGEKECFPLSRGGQVEHISLPALYRLICREMPGCKVKVLKMSAQATCKQFIANLDQS